MSGTPPDVAEVLRLRRRENYLDTPLPSARDSQITELAETLRDEESITRAARSVAAAGETVLSPYAQRAAGLAVRQRAPRFLRAGLRATALMAAGGDPRDVAIVLSLLWRSAELLGLDPATEFTAVGRSVGRHGEALHAFARRDPQDRTIQAMGYAEAGEGADFRYECRW